MEIAIFHLEYATLLQEVTKDNCAELCKNDLLGLLTFLGTVTKDKDIFVQAVKLVRGTRFTQSAYLYSYLVGLWQIFFPSNYFDPNNLFIEAL